MTEIWADYSGGRPSGAALRAAGFTGVIRYIGGGSSGKRLTVAEAHDLVSAGLQVRCVFEVGTTDSSGGYQAGVNNANAAVNDSAYQALPGQPIIYAANDRNESSATSVAYAQGFRDVLGAARTGVYGFGVYLNACRGLGLASHWQAGHPPSMTGTEDLVEFWQRQGTSGSTKDGPASPTTIVVGGVQCDINNRVNPAKGSVIDVLVTDPTGSKRPDGSDVLVGEALGNTYLGLFYDEDNPAVVNSLAKIETAVANLTQVVQSLVTAVANLSGTAPTELTGTATVNVSLAPAPKP